MADGEQVQASWIAYLKSKTAITSLLADADQIKEKEYQGDVFSYPGIRISVDYFPSINGCGPDDIYVFIDVFSEQKSSKEAAHIAAVIQSIIHKKPFTSLGINFPMVNVQKIHRPDRDIYSWKVTVPVEGLAV
jgi:hypothetical protein